MIAKITKLTARESRLLSSLDSTIRAWKNRRQMPDSDYEQAIADFEELRGMLLDGDDHRGGYPIANCNACGWPNDAIGCCTRSGCCNSD